MDSEVDLLTKASNVWTDKDYGRALEIVQCTTQVLRQEYTQFVSSRQDEALATWYGADGTSHKYKKSKLKKIGRHIAVRRLRHTTEFLQQRFFIIASNGSRSFLIPEAIVLSCKTVWAHFNQQRSMSQHPRELGHRGVLVRHGCWDGAVAKPCHKRSMQLEEATLLHLARRFDWSDSYCDLLRMKTWTTWQICCRHPSNGSFRWAFKEYAENRDFMKQLWIVHESLVNVASVILTAAEEWREQKIRFAPSTDDAWHELWARLGLPQEYSI